MPELLKIGQRVTHFSGGPDTHGKGTIVAYNGTEPNNYTQSNPKAAADAIGSIQDPSLKAAMMGAAVNSFYDKTRCPYIVRWDPRNDASEIGLKYPEGYKDVYGDECRPIKE